MHPVTEQLGRVPQNLAGRRILGRRRRRAVPLRKKPNSQHPRFSERQRSSCRSTRGGLRSTRRPQRELLRRHAPYLLAATLDNEDCAPSSSFECRSDS